MGFSRLVYSPKAFVYVKDADGHIRDLSAYVTRGSVSRKVNQLSTAEVTLRNPNMIFTDRKRGATFTPMDPITIYLQRLRNRPVRVFTGFLDQTPWLKLYPDTITLRASCTLKKLMYTFFDPALPYLNSFLREYGWLNTGQGEILNPEAASQTYDTSSNNPLQGIESPDGSIGNLLFATLKHIGNWDPKTIYIQDLPKDLPIRMAALAREWDEDNKKAKDQFEALMKAIIGSGAYGEGGGADTTIDLGDSRVPENVFLVGKQMSVPKKYLLAAMMTGLVECPQGTTFGNCKGGDADSAGWRQERASLYADPTNVPASAKRFFTECKQHDHGQSAGELAADVQRPRADLRGRYEGVRAKAEALLEKLEKDYSKKDSTSKKEKTTTLRRTASASASGPTQQIGTKYKKMTRYDAIVAEANRLDKLHTNYNNARPPNDQAGYDCSSTCATLMRAAGYKVPFFNTANAPDYMIKGKDPSGRLTFWNNDHARTAGNSVHIFATIGGRDFGTSRSNPGGGPGWADHPKDGFTPYHVKGLDEPADVPRNADTDVPGGDASQGDTSEASGTDQMYSIAQATAFASQLEWPSIEDTIEAVGLQGQKSLMNDKPLMPFIQQLTEAGLRQFQSMPNGHFYAFYPDYFGEFGRKPYWMIHDIEILDGGIDLNDEALTTHVYVVGDTIPGGIDQLDRLFSGGVVNIFNAFMAGDTILNRPQGADDKKHASQRFTQLIDKSDAIKFLQRYGARPQLFEEPMIRSPYFEAFLAYQKFMLLWSRQFLTTFTFTFMPELFPGGKVGFPDHGLQCYIEEVEHTWDYENGFFTQANLSAPSALPGAAGDDLPPNMVVQQALYEPISHRSLVTSPDGSTFPVTPSPDALETSPQ